jgi:hypothetical protein
MIEKKSDFIDIIVHDGPGPTRYLSLSKKKIKSFLYLAPLASLSIFFFLIFLLWWKGFTLPQLISVPKLPSAEEIKIQELEKHIIALETSQLSIQEKLALSDVKTDFDVWLGPVKKPYGAQNLVNLQSLKIENITSEEKNNRRILKFSLTHAQPERERIMGHIFVLQIDHRGMTSYPAITHQEWLDGIRYNKGESFAVSRLRPVEASFPIGDNDAHFLILIFNREGDLLIRQELQNAALQKK